MLIIEHQAGNSVMLSVSITRLREPDGTPDRKEKASLGSLRRGPHLIIVCGAVKGRLRPSSTARLR